MPDRPLPPEIARYAERPAPTPADRLDAYLADTAGEPLPRTLPWRERWRADAETCAAIIGLVGGVAALGWWWGWWG